MTAPNNPVRRQTFKQVKEGDQPSAAEWNKITRWTGELTGNPNQHPKKPTRAIKLMRLSEVMGQFGEGDPDVSEPAGSSQAHRRSGVVWYYDEVLDDFVETSNAETKTNITDALRLIYDNEEFVWCVYLEQSGHWHPLNPRTVRHARTVRQPNYDGSGTSNYPDYCYDRIYPIKFVKLEYEKDIDAAAPTSGTDLSPGTGPDDYVLNLFTGADCDTLTPYIGEGTVIWCYNVLQQWYTLWITECLGSSSSSSSSSLISTEPSSASSSSLSSQGSSLSSLSSSGGSSASSSSGGSSLSSSSESSGGSSASSSSLDDFTCVRVVRDISFNSETCTFTYDYLCICWPSNLGIIAYNTSGPCGGGG